MRKIAISSTVALLAGEAAAHVDHLNHPVDGLGHLVTDPTHVALIVIAVLAAGVLAVRARRARRGAPRA